MGGNCWSLAYLSIDMPSDGRYKSGHLHIENTTLWRNIKYAWLPFSAYQCLNALREALENILKNFGSKYQITFA